MVDQDKNKFLYWALELAIKNGVLKCFYGCPLLKECLIDKDFGCLCGKILTELKGESNPNFI